jgi:hypothetical protein
MWTTTSEILLRLEVQKLFRLRTPAKDILDVDWRNRVPRTEVLSIARELCGAQPPLFDTKWMSDFFKWYNGMAMKALKDLDQNWRITLKKFPVAPAWTRESESESEDALDSLASV